MKVLFDNFDKKQYVTAIKNGDKEVFAQVYAYYWKRLLAISFQHTNDKEMAEEIVQDVFISLWQRRNILEIEHLSSYLATAVKFSTFKMLHRTRRQEMIRDAVLPKNDHQLDEEVIDARFLQEYVDGIVEKLPERCRLVFQLSRKDQKSHQEIAKELHISEKAVEANITRALKVLRINLRRVGFSLFFLFFI
ncbi:RNA polymerase sigma-70 factor [Sphingobacterium haloxyli]|uniref:RNA polymerase subunit sigma-70 n=1 Tax=Sphingobacterium haloxyli TaxID=2100533 RepID=A0A2S9J886_9SPHI|nr:RNA polymerase sigma-70 factor [Sphingobacterium haloxyli]PRD48949.1 RNA polymerase subunit sigma-70 [Sphingobacterium haloxyli]